MKIRKINFLKIDAEGHDLDVLVGFRDMLASDSIEYIQVECTPTTLNSFHNSLEGIQSFLGVFGYYLFGFGEIKRQDNDRKIKTPYIWYFNAIFASSSNHLR